MGNAPAKALAVLVLVTALAIFFAWRAAASVRVSQVDYGTALVGLVGELGDVAGADPSITIAALDGRCGEGKWQVWYELGTSGDVVPGSIVVACE
jgi:hypothetical protein